jgi:histone deacetylase 1/2
VVQQVLRKNNISYSPKINPYICDSCQLANSHQLPYPVSTSVSTVPLEQVFSDVWGPAPESSGKHSYYVSFIDDFSKFTWIYLLKKRSDVYQVFLNFRQLVERNFDRKIITMQTDWGGEYEKLNSFFQKVGITHHVSCPHAHQQNGSAERKHRHIVEVGLALLANASMPLKFWDEAFLTATFLINLLPSKVINHDTPVERLLHTKPNYDSLRVFGCACWPNLRPYNQRKLSFRSTRCVFLGYSPRDKGVKCLDTSTGRVYISRDVVFDENIFPFAKLHPNAGRRLKQDILLLPHHTSNSGGANIDDYMPLPVLPIVTTNDEDIADNSVDADTSSFQQETARNPAQNAPEMVQNTTAENARRTDPEEDPCQAAPQGPPGIAPGSPGGRVEPRSPPRADESRASTSRSW